VITVDCWADGAVSGNGSEYSIGGWAFVMKTSISSKCFFKAKAVIGATNNQMELKAVLSGLKEASKRGLNPFSDHHTTPFTAVVNVYSDSAYVINAFNSGWTRNWIKNGWVNIEGEAVKNRDLWEKIIKEMESFKEVNFIKVSGHSGDVMNEFADTLATKVILEHKLKNK
jgi:ribonuclease HI